MKTYDRHTVLMADEREPRDNYHTLISCILPRPIAFVSTLSTDGVPNLAPFSFFNGVCANPPALVFMPATDRNGKDKDTLVNLRNTGECVVNVVPYDIRDAMNQTALTYPPDASEFDEAGFTKLPARVVAPSRVAESPVQMECRLIEIVKVGEGPLSGNVCICEVLCFHIAEQMCLPDGTADVAKLDLIGRLGGSGYSTVRDRFELAKPAPQK